MSLQHFSKTSQDFKWKFNIGPGSLANYLAFCQWEPQISETAAPPDLQREARSTEETRALVPRRSFWLSGLGPECRVAVRGIRFAVLLLHSLSSHCKVALRSQHLRLSQLPSGHSGLRPGAAPWVDRGCDVPESRLPM